MLTGYSSCQPLNNLCACGQMFGKIEDRVLRLLGRWAPVLFVSNNLFGCDQMFGKIEDRDGRLSCANRLFLLSTAQ